MAEKKKIYDEILYEIDWYYSHRKYCITPINYENCLMKAVSLYVHGYEDFANSVIKYVKAAREGSGPLSEGDFNRFISALTCCCETEEIK